MRTLISYDRYTELLSKTIHRTITPDEAEDVTRFEAAQPKTCPKCGNLVWTFLAPHRVAHDLDKCPGKSAAPAKP